MSTYSALTTVEGEVRASSIALALEQLEPAPVGVGIFEIEDGSGLWEVGAYYLEAPNPALLDLVSQAFGARTFAVSDIPEVDWVAKVRRELSPVEAGRFFVYGSHDAERAAGAKAAGKVTLQIEATVAFGTGHHGTTLGCLRAFDRLVAAGLRPDRVADIGCGTAVLALAAALVLPQARIIASDIDQIAVDVALANAAINGLQGRIVCVEAAGFAHPMLSKGAPYDLIFANILKGPLLELAPDMQRNCAPGGHLILSGLLTVQAESILAAYQQVGFELESRDDLGEWSALLLIRK